LLNGRAHTKAKWRHSKRREALKKAGGDAVRHIKKKVYLFFYAPHKNTYIHACAVRRIKKKERKSIPHVCPLKLPLQAVTSCEEVDALV
jgi:hypothetical protein